MNRAPWPTTWLVQIDRKKCTMCGLCARRCAPTALALCEGNARQALAFNSERCDGCGRCVAYCPEGAVGLVRLPQVDGAGESVEVMSATPCRCRNCGGSFLSQKLRLRVIRKSLAAGTSDAVVARRAEQAYIYCPECRWRLLALGGSGDE